VLVADDEAPARQRLLELLRRETRVVTILEAGDGRAAMDMIIGQRPDLVFLDIQMPELNGIEVVEAVGAARLPLTIFVTAYDRHAIRAFEANALDYLLKPYSDERLEAALARAIARIDERRMGSFGQQLMQWLPHSAPASASAPAQAAPAWLERIAVKSVRATEFVGVADIDWIEGAGAYVALHVAGRELLHRASLTELETVLDPLRFIRIHRSVIANIDSIARLEPISNGDFEVVLKSGERTRASRSYRAGLEKRLGQPL
jgi:two-component system LytT family response regulator